MPNDIRPLPPVKPVPQGPDGKRIALIVISIAVAVGLLVLGGFVLFGGRKPEPVEQPKTYEPAEETQVQTMPVLPGTAPTSAAVATAAAPATSPSTSRQAADRVAYRLGETLYVANKDGSERSSVVRVPEGEFALSPDGLTLAVAHDSRLTLYDAATGSPVEVSRASGGRPVWYPDSSAVLFETSANAGTTEVWRAKRNGTGLRRIQRGRAAAISPDGRTIVLIASQSASTGSGVSGALLVSRDGESFRTLRVTSGAPVSVAVGRTELFFSVTSSSGETRIMTSGLNGSGQTVFKAKPDAERPTTWGELMLSPDGKTLAAAAIGDDEYSRVSLFSLPNGVETKLSRRRDTRLRGWSGSSDCVFIVEGNAYQGETTNLICTAPDGSGAKTLVVGAR